MKQVPCDTVIQQIAVVCDEGKTNMLDIAMVQRLAYEHEFYELVVFIEEHRQAYIHFIFTGERTCCD